VVKEQKGKQKEINRYTMVDSKTVAYGGIIAVIGITSLVLWKTILGNTKYPTGTESGYAVRKEEKATEYAQRENESDALLNQYTQEDTSQRLGTIDENVSGGKKSKRSKRRKTKRTKKRK